MFKLLDMALKGYLIARVYLLVRKGRIIDAIKMVRAEYGHKRLMYGAPLYGDPPGTLGSLPGAKEFVTRVREGEWPETF